MEVGTNSEGRTVVVAENSFGKVTTKISSFWTTFLEKQQAIRLPKESSFLHLLSSLGSLSLWLRDQHTSPWRPQDDISRRRQVLPNIGKAFCLLYVVPFLEMVTLESCHRIWARFLLVHWRGDGNGWKSSRKAFSKVQQFWEHNSTNLVVSPVSLTRPAMLSSLGFLQN